MLDDPAVIERKFKRAVTDTDGEVRYDPRAKPGRLQPAVDPGRRHRHATPTTLAERLHAVRPAQGRHRRRRRRAAAPDPGALRASWPPTPPAVAELLAKGADKARAIAAATLDRAQQAVGLR